MKVKEVTMNKENRNVLVKRFMNTNDVNTEINIPLQVIQDLKLNIPMSRQQRRQIAKRAKMDWDLFKLLEKETMKRIRANVDLETGKPKDNNNENN